MNVDKMNLVKATDIFKMLKCQVWSQKNLVNFLFDYKVHLIFFAKFGIFKKENILRL